LSIDGTPKNVSLRDGRAVALDEADLSVEFHAGPAVERFPSRITWQCRVSVPGGGLLETSEEFPFVAPEAGYSTSDEWTIGTTNWTQQVNKQYFLKLRDGAFGRLKLRVIGAKEPFFRLESFVNRDGSRDLEPAN